MPPLYVRIQGLNHPLVSGVATRISCSSAGARPQPEIVWNKDSNEIQTMMRSASKTVCINLHNSRSEWPLDGVCLPSICE